MHICLYKGPPTDLAHKIAHKAVCWFTGSKYSHCELLIGGLCYSSSARDGGVRAKAIDLTSGRWDVYPIEGDEKKALQWFIDHMGKRYDWAGIARFVIPFLPKVDGQWFCSEACGAALGLDNPQDLTPASFI